MYSTWYRVGDGAPRFPVDDVHPVHFLVVDELAGRLQVAVQADADQDEVLVR